MFDEHEKRLLMSWSKEDLVELVLHGNVRRTELYRCIDVCGEILSCLWKVLVCLEGGQLCAECEDHNTELCKASKLLDLVEGDEDGLLGVLDLRLRELYEKKRKEVSLEHNK